MGLASGKAVLVTGAAAGIGRATALKFAAEGAKLALADIDAEGARETEALIRKAGGEAFACRCDVTRAAEVAAVVRQAVEVFGRIDCACNNAGIGGKVAPLAEQSEQHFDHVIAVNLKGVFLCLRAEIPVMVHQGGGAIVNVASVAGLSGFLGLSPYVASKHAVAGLTKNAALDYAKQGVRVNAVCPGSIDTRMLESLAEQVAGLGKMREVLDPLHPIGRIGTPEEVAELIVWLCSPRASFLTGAIIPVDGGYTAQ
jgi:NAD(P)-dependent dehydrogenase (short-subunit alcohol dehydrogenase family)